MTLARTCPLCKTSIFDIKLASSGQMPLKVDATPEVTKGFGIEVTIDESQETLRAYHAPQIAACWRMSASPERPLHRLHHCK